MTETFLLTAAIVAVFWVFVWWTFRTPKGK